MLCKAMLLSLDGHTISLKHNAGNYFPGVEIYRAHGEWWYLSGSERFTLKHGEDVCIDRKEYIFVIEITPINWEFYYQQ